MTEQLFAERGADRLAIQLYERADAATAVLIVPAMGVPARYYDRFATALHEAGREVAVLDLRGAGASTPAVSRSSRADYADLADDVGAVLDLLAERRAGRRTVLLGHSLGGQACVMHLARSGRTDVAALVLIAAGMPYWRAYGPTAWQAQLLRTAVTSVTAVLGFWPGWGFGGPQTAGVMGDWAHTSSTGEFPPRLGVTERLPELTLPTLVVTVDGDEHTPPAVVEKLTELLVSAPVDREHITAEFAGTKLDHFRWVKAAAPVAKVVLEWEAAH
ncbi:alpha/beta fold hydrolase [Nocardia sp. NPDC005978]|uniref:alpha/beta fold hydrolase n=1 Tax=unclassified Nocardia TaxID=2637762 RepID=UPI0033B52E2B